MLVNRVLRKPSAGGGQSSEVQCSAPEEAVGKGSRSALSGGWRILMSCWEGWVQPTCSLHAAYLGLYAVVVALVPVHLSLCSHHERLALGVAKPHVVL